MITSFSSYVFFSLGVYLASFCFISDAEYFGGYVFKYFYLILSFVSWQSNYICAELFDTIQQATQALFFKEEEKKKKLFSLLCSWIIPTDIFKFTYSFLCQIYLAITLIT